MSLPCTTAAGAAAAPSATFGGLGTAPPAAGGLTPTRAEIGDLSLTVLGAGTPVTVFSHGLGGCGADLRGLARWVPGTRVLLDLPGHGASRRPADTWTYPALAAAVAEVITATGATRAVGVSASAGALLNLLADDSRIIWRRRLERVALLLPAALNNPRDGAGTHRLAELGAAIDRGDLATVTELLLAGLPESVRTGHTARGARLHARAAAARLVTRPAPRPDPATVPVADPGSLPRLGASGLVIAESGDPLHPLSVAAEVADALDSRLVVLDPGALLWTQRQRSGALLADFLT